MKSGYLGFITKPKGDFSLACSCRVGRLGLSFCWSYCCTAFCFPFGRDLPLIIAYFYALKTSFWMCWCVERGRYSSPTFFFSILLSYSRSNSTSWSSHAPSQVRHAKLLANSGQEHFLHRAGYPCACSSQLCLHLSGRKATCRAVSRLTRRSLSSSRANTFHTLLVALARI